MKKITKVLLILCVVITFIATIPNGYCAKNKKSDNSNVIYFRVPVTGDNSWEGYDTIYCHMWQDGGDEFFTWQTTYEKCTRVKGNLWKYNLDNLNYSRGAAEQLQDGVTYAVIFSDNIGDQTYDLYFTSECVGDTVVCTTDTMDNPMNSAIKCLVATWSKNGDKYNVVEYNNTKVESTSSPADIHEVNENQDEDTLSSNMNRTIIAILSCVIIVLAIILVFKTGYDKKRKSNKDKDNAG